MDVAQKVIAQNYFRLKLLEAKGNAFQDIFERIIEKAESEFQKVRPHGRIGDKKNDGFIPSKGVYYQVYAPEKPKETVKQTVKKIKEDFQGLFSWWKGKYEVKRFFFVLNDEYKGVSPLVHEVIADLNKQHTSVDIRLFSCSDLQKMFFGLSDPDVQEIIGYIPLGKEIALVDIGVLTDVISHLIENEKPATFDSSLKLPNFDEKIKFNNLSKAVESLLKNASYQVFVLEQYFSLNPDIKEILQKIFTKFYNDSEKEVPAEIEESSDLVFFKIAEKACGNNSSNKAAQDAIFTLMAAFFETCDIFKEPR